MNLTEKFPPMPAVDIVFLRNVLIYFSPDAKNEILRRFQQALKPGGVLFIGATEALLGAELRSIYVQFEDTLVSVDKLRDHGMVGVERLAAGQTGQRADNADTEAFIDFVR